MRNESNDFKKGRKNFTKKENDTDISVKIDFINNLINEYTQIIEQNYEKIEELSKQLDDIKKEGNFFKNRSHKNNLTSTIKFLEDDIKRKKTLVMTSEKLKKNIEMDNLCKIPQ